MLFKVPNKSCRYKHEMEKRQRLEIRPNASARGETQKRWEGEKGDGLGSAAPTRQLNAPRA